MIKKYSFLLTKKIFKLLTFVLIALFIAISAQISFPLPNGVPITLQTFGIALVGYYFYKENKGVKSILTYLMLGLIGMPVFAQGNCGLHTLLGLTGGFIVGFIFLVYFCGLSQKIHSIFAKILLSIIGLLICHLCGILQYSFLTKINIINSALLVSVPFLIKDTISVLSAMFIVHEVKTIKK